MLVRVSSRTLRRTKEKKLKALEEIYKEGEKPRKPGRPKGSKGRKKELLPPILPVPTPEWVANGIREDW